VDELILTKYNLVYINCTELYTDTFKKIQEVGLDKLTRKDTKKLIFHYVITDFLKISKIRKSKEKPVFFFYSDKFLDVNSSFLLEFINVIKMLKSFLPVPVLIFKNDTIFIKNNGELKGLNEKIYNFYSNRNHSVKKLRKYLETEEYYQLIEVLKDVGSIKTLVN
jgi:hypothetical protein